MENKFGLSKKTNIAVASIGSLGLIAQGATSTSAKIACASFVLAITVLAIVAQTIIDMKKE